MPDNRRSTSTWVPGPLRCTVDAGGHQILVDEPPSAGGTDQGPGPTDLFLASYASCLTLAVVWSARKRGLEPAGVEVTIEGEYDGPRFRRLVADVVCTGLTPDDTHAVLAAARRVCYVSNTLANPPEIEVRNRSAGR